MNTRSSVLTTTFLIGLACAGYAFYHLYGNWKLVDNGVRTTASVFYLDMRLDRIHSSSFKYYRVDDYSDECFKTVVYHTKGGERIIWQSRISTDLPDWLRGEHVYEERAASILYDPENPHYWEFEKTMALFVNWFVLLLAGMALMSLSFGPYDAVMRRLRDSDEDRQAALTSIREELYAPIPPTGKRASAEPEKPQPCDTIIRTSPVAIDADAHVPMTHEDAADSSFAQEDHKDEFAFARHTEMPDGDDDRHDGFGSAEDPFAGMR